MIGIVARLAWPTGPGAFRLWLALVVVLHHFTRIEFGKAPVLVFFALSGFWVHRVWGARYATTRRPYLTFIVSRWWRIAPVLVATTLITLGTMAALGQWAQLDTIWASRWSQLGSALLGLGYGQMEFRPVGPAWSLDVEMQFYLLAPLLISAVRRLSWVAALTTALIAQMGALIVFAGTWVTTYLAFFVVGMLAAEHKWQPARTFAASGLLATIALTVVIMASPWEQVLLGEGSGDAQLFSLGLAVLALPFALYSVGQPSDATDGNLADHSYTVYLLHWPAILVFRSFDWNGPADAFGVALGLSGVIAGMSWAVWKTIDRPLEKRRSHWVHTRRQTPVTSPPPAVPKEGDPKTGDIASQFA